MSLKSLITTSFIIVIAHAAHAADTLDARLVGTWKGDRVKPGNCLPIKWEGTRTSDGKYNVKFFFDDEGKLEIGEEKGTWNSKNGKIYYFIEGEKTPDVEIYKFTSPGKLELTTKSFSPSSECKEIVTSIEVMKEK